LNIALLDHSRNRTCFPKLIKLPRDAMQNGARYCGIAIVCRLSVLRSICNVGGL